MTTLVKSYTWNIGTAETSGYSFGKKYVVTIGMQLEAQLPTVFTGTSEELFTYLVNNVTIHREYNHKILNMVVVKNTVPLGAVSELRKYAHRHSIHIHEAHTAGTGKILKL